MPYQLNFQYVLFIPISWVWICQSCISTEMELHFFSVRLLLVLRSHSVFSSLPQRPMTSDFEWFSIPDLIHYIYFPILILEKESVFPFSMLSAKQGSYWFHLVWRGPWQEIEPGTSRPRSQHYTTRLSRRRSLTGDWTRDLTHSKPALYH